jgi:hypothetical protein
MQGVVKIKRDFSKGFPVLLIRDEARKGFLRVAALGNDQKTHRFLEVSSVLI